MNPHWIGFIVFIVIIMGILGAVGTGQSLTLDGEESAVDPNVNDILSYSEAWQDNPWGTLVNPIAHATFFSALFGLLIGQYSLYSIFPEGSSWLWIWIVIWTPIVATVVFGVVMMFVAILQRIIS